MGRRRQDLSRVLPRVGPRPRTKWIVIKLPAVRGGLGLCDCVKKMLAQAKKARARIEFGKLNFASDYYHCRYTSLHIPTTISNDQFASAVLDLFTLPDLSVKPDFGSPSRGQSPTAGARGTRHKRRTKRTCLYVTANRWFSCTGRQISVAVGMLASNFLVLAWLNNTCV